MHSFNRFKAGKGTLVYFRLGLCDRKPSYFKIILNYSVLFRLPSFSYNGDNI